METPATYQTVTENIVVRVGDVYFSLAPAEELEMLTFLQRRAWVPVGARLPEVETVVLCARTGNQYPFLAFIWGDKWRDMHGRTTDTPTHWQPLPAGPKAGV